MIMPGMQDRFIKAYKLVSFDRNTPRSSSVRPRKAAFNELIEGELMPNAASLRYVSRLT